MLSNKRKVDAMRTIAAGIGLLVGFTSLAIASEEHKLYVFNNTSFDFTNGHVKNHQQVNIQSVPTTIKAGQNNYIHFKTKDSAYDVHMDVHYDVDTGTEGSVAVIWQFTDASAKCRTDTVPGITAQYTDCADKNVNYTFTSD